MDSQELNKRTADLHRERKKEWTDDKLEAT